MTSGGRVEAPRVPVTLFHGAERAKTVHDDLLASECLDPRRSIAVGGRKGTIPERPLRGQPGKDYWHGADSAAPCPRVRLSLALSLAAACLLPVETTWSFVASAQESPAPSLPSLPSPDSSSPTPPPASLPPATASTVKVHLVTNATGVQFLFRPASAPASASKAGAAEDVRRYTASCLAPCDLELPPGDYFVALSRLGGKTHEQEMPLSLRSATTVEGIYESHSGTRVVGIVLLSTLVPFGVVLSVAAASNTTSNCSEGPGFNQCTSSPETAVLAVGLISLGIGAVLGTALILQHDQTAVQIVPAAGPLALHAGPSEHSSVANGLSLRVTF
jgi:hypothetical protein